jgi:hypothetical protein
MKNLLILSFLSVCFFAESQCCPYIDSIEVIPASPTTTDNIKIVTTVTTASLGQFIYSTHAVNGNNIQINACYFTGMLPATQTYYDTLVIGTLPAGNYNVDLTAYNAYDTICSYADSTTSMVNFTVTEPTNSILNPTMEIGQLYPNPTTGSFTIRLPEGIKATDICIRTISGRIVHEGVFTKEMSVNFDSGMYLIEFRQNESILGYHRLLID